MRYPPGWFVDDAGTEIRTSKATIQETWKAMESLSDAGLARSIGVSNFQAQLLYDLLRHARIRPATLQVEHHPYLVQDLLLRAARNEGVAVTAYSSFGPAGFVELDMARAKDAVPLMSEQTVAGIATKHGKTPAQVLLRWATQRGVAVIPKSSSEGRMKENLESVAFDLDDKEVAAISALDKNLRFNQPTNVSPCVLLLFPRAPWEELDANFVDLDSTSRPRSFGSSARVEDGAVCSANVSFII